MQQNLLILNTSFNPNEGAGITIRNLLSVYPPDQIGNATNICYEDKSICSKYFSFSNNYITAKSNDTLILDKQEFKFRIIKQALIGFKNLFEGLGLLNRIDISPEFVLWLKNNQFNVVYAVSFSARDIPFLISIIKKTKLPFIIHIYDDWIRHNRYGFFLKLFAPIIENRFKYLLKKSSGRICISEKMAEVYEQRYGGKFEVFHNPCPDDFLQINPKKQRQKKIDISIFGTVGDNNIEEILLLNHVIEKNFYNQIEINIYGSVRRQSILEIVEKHKTLKIHGHISHEVALAKMKLADILFLPLSFKKQFKQYFELSMPTKVTEYLGSNVPILLFAPGTFAVTEYLETNKAAIVVSVFSEEFLKQGIESAIINNNEIEIILKNARDLALRKHSKTAVSKCFAAYAFHIKKEL